MTGALEMHTKEWQGMDARAAPSYGTCDRLEFAAKYRNKYAAIYAIVVVEPRDGGARREVFLALTVTGKSVVPRGDGSEEWSLLQIGRPLGKGWDSFEVSLPHEVERVAEEQRKLTLPVWHYREFKGVRLRGNISVSPIALQRTVESVRVEQSATTISPKELFDAVERARSDNRDVTKNYEGKPVDWRTKFQSLDRRTGDTFKLTLQVDDLANIDWEYRADWACCCDITESFLAEHPGLQDAPDGKPFRITGKIDRFDNGVWIRDPELHFVGLAT
jgi:hypothetical protein